MTTAAHYKGYKIFKTKRGYEVLGLVFQTLPNATDAIDAI